MLIRFGDRIQKAISAAIDNIITPIIELAVRSINVSPGRDAASVYADSERGEHIGIIASFENVSKRNNTFHELKLNDETQKNIPDEVDELSVPRTYFDRKLLTHRSWLKDFPSMK